MGMTRRTMLAGLGATAALGAPGSVRAQGGEPIRLGLLTVKTGPLASGGIDMERAVAMYLKERGNVLAGRKVELIVGDTGGVPATTRTKAQELVERNNVHAFVGPLAAFEALAIDDYIRQREIPTLCVAGAEDITQRKVNPWVVRPTVTSAQCAHPLADYCAKALKFKRMITIADDFAFGHEMAAGFQRVFEDAGGKIVQKVFPPLAVPDYGTYIAQLKTNADGIFLGFAGSNGFRFLRQFVEYGLKDKIVPVGGMTALDEAVLRNMGDEALGIETASWYSAELDTPQNKVFAPAFRKAFSYDPGLYAASTYVDCAVLDSALQAVSGRIENKKEFMDALRQSKTNTINGPVRFDPYGNAICNVYIRKVERKDGRLVNVVTKTYEDVGQFWTYEPKAFLANPVYSREFPPARNLEN